MVKVAIYRLEFYFFRLGLYVQLAAQWYLVKLSTLLQLHIRAMLHLAVTIFMLQTTHSSSLFHLIQNPLYFPYSL